MAFGTFSSIFWTLFYFIYHIALLNYPSIYYTKTCVFTLFLASLANITIAISLQDPFSFAPNAISIILSILQFTKYSYDLMFNFNAFSLSKFIKFRKITNKMDFIEAADYSNNAMAKYNPNSIPNRRKKMLYEKQERMKLNMEIKFDNDEWMRHSIISDSPSEIYVVKHNKYSEIQQQQQYKSRVKDKYRGHGAEKTRIKVFSILFVLFSVFIHYSIIFMTEVFENEDNKDYRFNVIHGLLLFQWILCLTFLITWYQNYRFEYAIDKLLADGYSLYYLMQNKNTKLLINESLNEITQEMQTLSMHSHHSISNNDINLVTPIPEQSNGIIDGFDVALEEQDEDYSDLSDPDDIVEDIDEKEKKQRKMIKISKCCACLRFFSVGILRLIRFLPWILLLNGGCWIIFGVYICDIEIIWLQHAISVCVSGLYLVFSLCMNERHLILQKETQINLNHFKSVSIDENGNKMFERDDEERKEKEVRNQVRRDVNHIRNIEINKMMPKKPLPGKPSPTKPLPRKPLPPAPINVR